MNITAEELATLLGLREPEPDYQELTERCAELTQRVADLTAANGALEKTVEALHGSGKLYESERVELHNLIRSYCDEPNSLKINDVFYFVDNRPVRVAQAYTPPVDNRPLFDAIDKIVESIKDVPLPDDSGPTREQVKLWLDVAFGSAHMIARGYPETGDGFDELCRLCWTAARERMVPVGCGCEGTDEAIAKAEARVRELEQQLLATQHDRYRILTERDQLRDDLHATQDELRVCKGVRDDAERTVTTLRGELAAENLRADAANLKLRPLETANQQLHEKIARLQSDLAALRGEEWTEEQIKAKYAEGSPPWRSTWESTQPLWREFLVRFANACRVRPNQDRELNSVARSDGALTVAERKVLDSLLIDWMLLDTTESQLGFIKAKEAIFDHVSNLRSAAVSAIAKSQAELVTQKAKERDEAKRELSEVSAMHSRRLNEVSAWQEFAYDLLGKTETTPDAEAQAALTAELTALRSRYSVPLTDEQRTELANLVYTTLRNSPRYPECHDLPDWLSVIDAIAPRIARVGVFPVSPGTAARELKDSIACTPEGHVVIDAHQFSKAIIERATGADK